MDNRSALSRDNVEAYGEFFVKTPNADMPTTNQSEWRRNEDYDDSWKEFNLWNIKQIIMERLLGNHQRKHTRLELSTLRMYYYLHIDWKDGIVPGAWTRAHPDLQEKGM